MNRFHQERQTSHLLRRMLTAAAVMCCALFFLLQGLEAISETTTESYTESLRQAILRSAVHCYAAEGAYPESLDYLRTHYGLDWDTEKYVVDYEITASNRMPSVIVIPLDG